MWPYPMLSGEKWTVPQHMFPVAVNLAVPPSKTGLLRMVAFPCLLATCRRGWHGSGKGSAEKARRLHYDWAHLTMAFEHISIIATCSVVTHCLIICVCACLASPLVCSLPLICWHSLQFVSRWHILHLFFLFNVHRTWSGFLFFARFSHKHCCTWFIPAELWLSKYCFCVFFCTEDNTLLINLSCMDWNSLLLGDHCLLDHFLIKALRRILQLAALYTSVHAHPATVV